MFAAALANLNTILNVAMLLGLALAVGVFAPRAWRAAASRAREEEMQRTILAYKGRVEALEPEVKELRDEVRECRDTAVKWEERYHEQSKYTAKDALTSVLHEMADTRTLIHTSMESFSELVMEHSRLVAAALQKLDDGADRREARADARRDTP